MEHYLRCCLCRAF